MDQPLGFVDPQNASLVCKLHKALYGLKQDPRAWFSTFSSFLLSEEFIQSKCDSSLFIRKSSTSVTYILIYVGNILFTGNNQSYIQTLLAHMHLAFSMKKLGNISYFLGISVQPNSHGFFLSQYTYATELLVKAGMVDCKPYAIPISVKLPNEAADSLPCAQPFLYRSIDGTLQYLTITRPELSYVVNQACQFMHSPTVGHLSLVKLILRYVKGTLVHGLHFTSSHFGLHAYSDSNWAGDLADKRSTSSYCVYLGNNLISWSSKKQSTVSRSSTEAEYRSSVHTAAELTWLQMLLVDFSIPHTSLPVLWCDYLSSISLSTNSAFHSRSKHIEVDCHFVRDKVVAHQLILKYVHTTDQLAVIFTKPLSTAHFSYLTHKLMVSHLPMCLTGDDRERPSADHNLADPVDHNAVHNPADHNGVV
ncbi:uncharacterized protein LOC114256321 [Camellia sinensis]|uniref:uncharacterized protein LOC114256321 n=1 Tax=Camellia sinensis TaxID=4442 RepID=UPI0010359190|nr:uncharacterized protein LOC114256321 [Camellia sinensis]